MKIAYLVNNYPHTSHSFIRREIIGLENWGIEVKRFSIRPYSSQLVDKADFLELEKTRSLLAVGLIGLLIAVIRVFFSKPINFLKSLKLTVKIGWHSDRGLARNLAYLAEACVFLKYCSDAEINHTHAHFGTNSTTVAMLCYTLGGPPYSFTIHGPQEFDRATVLALDEKVKRASFLVTISSFSKSQLYRWCERRYWSKIHVVHCGVDEIFLHQQSPTPMSDEPRLVCVGRLDEQKGHLLLVEAAAKLAAEGLNFKLVFVGDGSFRPEIENAIAHLNLHKHIEITGWASNTQVREQILAARALVLPSFAEGLPVVAMEALALGRPVISSCVAGVPELIEHDKCGWLITPGSLDDLTATMEKVLYLQPDILINMGKVGSELVAQNHNITLETKKLAELFLGESISLTIKTNGGKKKTSTLKQQAIQATAWSLIDSFGGYAIRFGSNLLLTRLLVPECFGLMALIHPFISGLQMFSDIGIGTSIIQNKRGNDPDFLNTAWTIQVIRGLALWLATLLIVWPIAHIYQQPSFLWLVPLVGLNPLIAGFNSTSMFIFRRELEASKLTRYELLGYVYMNIITIVWAFLNPTIWALVGGSLVSKFINVIRSHRLIPTISNHFAWDKNAVKEIFSFGRWIFISTMMTFLATQTDRLMLGKLFPLEILGVYAVAIALAEMPRQLIQNISRKVIFPIIAKFQDLPRKQLRDKISKKRWLLLIGMAFVVSMVVGFGDLLILALYDNRYKDAAWMLPILSLGMWPGLLVITNTTVLMAIGKPIYASIGNFVKFIYMFIGVKLGFYLMGFLGVIIVIACNDLPVYAVVIYGLWEEKLSGIWQDFVTTIFMCLLIFCIILCRHFIGFELSASSLL